LQGSIFLNVDDPNVDAWVFLSADQMAFENHDLLNIQHVRSFLLPYRALLEVAGVVEVKYPDVDTSPALENTDESVLRMMRRGFARQRSQFILTDVVFTAEEDRDNDDAPRFFAHRSFLSVFGSYFDDMFTGGFAEGGEASARNPLKRVLPYSRFAIRSVLGRNTFFATHLLSWQCTLDYCYTGEVISPNEQDISLEDLLQSLELSHYLDVQSLFHNIQLVIIKRKLIKLPNVYDGGFFPFASTPSL
jgi:BTB/POZ domain